MINTNFDEKLEITYLGIPKIVGECRRRLVKRANV